ncbi:MAG: carboxypeptidase-like regulatory domain-containing protein [Planctomycetaceae bacterium]|jgi:hypothetical protein|nr:carboxypeptidase-like regulatory domain-containing protein [Planctomycetaceae bacterium]
MKYDHLFSFIVSLFVILFLNSGCNHSGLSGLVVCKGKVMLDAVPLEGATVTLIPNIENVTKENQQRNAFSITDSAGRFTMTTLKENDGVYPGDYWLIVTKYDPSGEFIKTGEIDLETGEDILFEKSVNRLPAIYENYRESQLRVTVPDSGIRDIVLELTTR